ncbi:anthranilate synthase component I family protein [Mesoterricola silvestris]|uniref:Aminodeoxychorismate synthase, component I n=1 Tax=Mesoterricola silvestris TaxID=2927979 RepID=A0AA48GTI3_9BACT|nr:anthranilate synthase component I family protein [Mesoterricola silvestris]BDU73757.1 aminodeoxychorismate synthase, component I [Mesoterricola silvestris]
MRSWDISETWRARTCDLDEAAFFEDLPATPFAFLHGKGRWLILAEDPLLELDDLALGDLRFHRRGEAPEILPDLVALAAYERGYALDPALPPRPFCGDPVPDVRLTLYRTVRVYDRARGVLHTALREGPPADRARHALGRGAFRAWKTGDTEDAASHMAKVARIREEIARGNVYQVNLARQETWAFEGSLAVLARRLHALDPAPYSALVADPRWTLASSSPECFLRIEGGRLLTRPIKGTAPRHPDPARDLAAARELLASAKDRSELAMIVDLLRNDLGRFCGPPPVRVDAFALLESYAHVHHLVADVSGALPASWTFGGLLEALFPGGSITGCPKLAAMALIRELEPLPRRLYTGSLGWLRSDLAQGEFALLIRSAWAAGTGLRFGVGGAVVWDSDPAAEYEETVHKGRSLVRCLSS